MRTSKLIKTLDTVEKVKVIKYHYSTNCGRDNEAPETYANAKIEIFKERGSVCGIKWSRTLVLVNGKEIKGDATSIRRVRDALVIEVCIGD